MLEIFFFVAMSISGIYAMNDQLTNGVISTGAVDIKLDTYQIDNQGQMINYDYNSKKVSPGETISYIPQVSNIGEDCYLRVKVNYVNENVDFINYVTGFSNELNKIGEYYYYNKVLNQNDVLKIFDTIKIPNNIKDLTDDNKIKLEIIAQAIQDINFEPDYSAEDPWKGINPTESIDISHDIETDLQIDIKYENGISDDFIIPANFFENLKRSMPGDSFTNSLEIRNLRKNEVKYFLRFTTAGLIDKDIELLGKMNLTILNQEGKVLYSGKFLEQDRILLGEYKLNQTDKLTFNVSVPADLGNDYILLNPRATLIFSAEYKEKDIIKRNDKIENPGTGDKIDWAITIFLISSIGMVIVRLLEFRERENIDSINLKNNNINPVNGEKGEKDE